MDLVAAELSLVVVSTSRTVPAEGEVSLASISTATLDNPMRKKRLPILRTNMMVNGRRAMSTEMDVHRPRQATSSHLGEPRPKWRMASGLKSCVVLDSCWRLL